MPVVLAPHIEGHLEVKGGHAVLERRSVLMFDEIVDQFFVFLVQRLLMSTKRYASRIDHGKIAAKMINQLHTTDAVSINFNPFAHFYP